MHDIVNHPKVQQLIWEDLVKQRDQIKALYLSHLNAVVKDYHEIHRLRQELDNRNEELAEMRQKFHIEVTVTVAKPDAEPTEPVTDTATAEPTPTPAPTPDPALLARAQQLAQLKEVKAVISSSVLAMTDGRWQRLCNLLGAGGELESYIAGSRVKLYILMAVLCDTGWIHGVSHANPKELSQALRPLLSDVCLAKIAPKATTPDAQAKAIAEKIRRGKSDVWLDREGYVNTKVYDWPNSTKVNRQYKAAPQHVLDLLNGPDNPGQST